jgi:hypothetical protein
MRAHMPPFTVVPLAMGWWSDPEVAGAGDALSSSAR